MPGNEIYEGIEQRRAFLERTRENSARLARTYATHRTYGWGEVTVNEAVQFQCSFITRPYFTSGVEIVDLTTLPGHDSDPIAGRFPRVSAGVWNWVRDTDGFYTGAYVYFVVETMGFQQSGGTYPVTVDPGYVIDHHMVFEAVSYKDLNIAGLDY